MTARKCDTRRLKDAKCTSRVVKILSQFAKAPCGVNPLVSEAGGVTFLPHLRKVSL